jgi:ribA/ribD-fused uncharacterized protein
MSEVDPILFYGHRHAFYGWLSNFYASPFEVEGKTYATVEHYFQAAKASNDFDHERIRNAEDPHTAKRLGRKVIIRKDWEEIKEDVMLFALSQKFMQHPKLAEWLLETGDAVLHENSPTDPDWGWLKGAGKDLLGKLLMQVRATLRKAAKAAESATNKGE